MLMCISSDLREAEDIVPKYWGEGVHKEDILCMAELEPDIIATASYDGDIVLWDVEIQQPLAVLNNQDRSKNGQMFNKLHRKLSTLKKKMRDTEESGSTCMFMSICMYLYHTGYNFRSL